MQKCLKNNFLFFMQPVIKIFHINVTYYHFHLLLYPICVITAWRQVLCLMWNKWLCSETCWLYGESDGVMPLWASSGTNEVKSNFWGAIVSCRKWSLFCLKPHHIMKGVIVLTVVPGGWLVGRPWCLKTNTSTISSGVIYQQYERRELIFAIFDQLCAALTSFRMKSCIFEHNILHDIVFHHSRSHYFFYQFFKDALWMRDLLHHNFLHLHLCFWHSGHTAVNCFHYYQVKQNKQTNRNDPTVSSFYFKAKGFSPFLWKNVLFMMPMIGQPFGKMLLKQILCIMLFL